MQGASGGAHAACFRRGQKQAQLTESDVHRLLLMFVCLKIDFT
jgi:hypothetical protein